MAIEAEKSMEILDIELPYNLENVSPLVIPNDP
jgi:hypothetical protein